MRIAVIGTRGFPDIQGGVERHCECLYTRFGTSVESIKVYRRRPYLSSISKAAQYSRITFVDLPSTRIKGLEAVLHTFLCCMHLLFHRVDVVHVHNIGPGMFSPLLRLFGMKVVITYHSANYEHKKWGGFAKSILRMSESLSFKFANKIVFVNKFQMQKAPQSIQAKSVYIPNGIDAVCFCKNDTDFEKDMGFAMEIEQGLADVQVMGSESVAIGVECYIVVKDKTSGKAVQKTKKIWFLNCNVSPASTSLSQNTDSTNEATVSYGLTIKGSNLMGSDGVSEYVDANGNTRKIFKISCLPDNANYATFLDTVPVPKAKA